MSSFTVPEHRRLRWVEHGRILRLTAWVVSQLCVLESSGHVRCGRVVCRVFVTYLLGNGEVESLSSLGTYHFKTVAARGTLL
jgi:hypothetical protein